MRIVLYYSLILFNWLDYISTILLIGKGKCYEYNPVANYFLNDEGLGLFIYKMFVVPFLIILIVALTKGRLLIKILTVLNIVYGTLCLYHVYLWII